MTLNDANEHQGKKPVVAVVPMAAIGHMQMLLPIVKELLLRGTEVHMFLDDLGEGSTAEAAWKPLLALGLKRQPFVSLVSNESTDYVEVLTGKYMPLVKEDPSLSAINDMMSMRFLGGLNMNCELLLPLMEKLENIRPDCIFFDTMHLCGHLAGKILSIPTIGYVSYPGPGCIEWEEDMDRKLKAKEPQEYKRRVCKPIMDKYNVDVLEEIYDSPGCPCYSDYLNIVTTIEELAQKEAKVHEIRLPTFKYIGPATDESLRLNATFTPKAAKDEEGKQVEHRRGLDSSPAGDACVAANSFLDVTGEIPWKDVTDAKLSGRKIICLSFGTVLTSVRWNKFAAAGEEDKKEEGKINLVGGADTGKELCQRLWKNLFKIFGEDPNVLFIASIGKQEDALEGEGLQVPSNFIIRQQIPQLKVLQHADVFITHGGWNSLQESLQYGVPMLVLPGFGDQPKNARKISETGAGIGIEEPYVNASVDVLKSSLVKLLHEDSYKATAEAFSKKLTESNGPQQAADLILSCI